MIDISVIKNWRYHQHYFNKNWHYHKVPITILLGNIPLYTYKVWLQVREIGLEDNAPPMKNPIPPPVPLHGNSQGFLVRSVQVEEQQPILQRTQDYISYIPYQYSRYYIDMQQSFEEYKSQFSSKTISTINRKIRKYTKFCNDHLSWRVYNSVNEMDEFYQFARTVSEKTYQEKLYDEGLPDSDKFLNEMKLLSQHGNIQGFILFHKDKPVSYLYCPVSDHTLIYAYVGYDPDYTNHSVGTILYWLALEFLFQKRSFHFFDFTEGESDQKKLFATHNIRCANVFFIRYNLNNIIMLQSKKAVDMFCSSIGTLLDKVGKKGALKKIIRSGNLH